VLSVGNLIRVLLSGEPEAHMIGDGRSEVGGGRVCEVWGV
jgi:hypothetical protein